MKLVKKQNYIKYIFMALLGLGVAFVCSLNTGKYPLQLSAILQGEEVALNVFWTLRFPRSCMAMIAGFGLGMVGMIYQTVFQNPLASPDIIGVSSGACAGAAFAILFVSGGAIGITLCAFVGSIGAVILALGLSMVVPGRGNISMVLSGLAVQSLAQTMLMALKLMADPEKELAAIEYWIMGSFNAITGKEVSFPFWITMIGTVLLLALYRQVLMLSMEEIEATMLGVPVRVLRVVILLIATLVVASIVSVTGVIGFVGLIAPHCARLLMKSSRMETMVLSGLLGSMLLLVADILARSAAPSELPVSVFTTLVGAPFLVWIMVRKER